MLAYLDSRAALARGEAAEFTCLLGTLVQEMFATHPGLRAAAGARLD